MEYKTAKEIREKTDSHKNEIIKANRDKWLKKAYSKIEAAANLGRYSVEITYSEFDEYYTSNIFGTNFIDSCVFDVLIANDFKVEKISKEVDCNGYGISFQTIDSLLISWDGLYK